MSKAARRMDLTQPSISLQIQALERDLDVILFERRGPKFKLTPDGKTLFRLAKNLVEGFDTLEEEFSAQRDSIERGRLDIAAGGSTIQYVLPGYVEKFINEHPKIDLKLHNVTGEGGLALLQEGKVDFCVGPLTNTPENIEFHPVITYDPVLIAPKDHPLAKRKNITLKDIHKYPLVLPPRHLSTWRQVEMVFAQHNLNYNVTLEVGGWEVIKKYVELGMGISIVMSNCITGNENLAVIPVDRFFPQRTYGVVFRRQKFLSPQAKGFIKTMVPGPERDGK